jgi:hypothetical protein
VRTKASSWSGALDLQLGRGEMKETKAGWAGVNKNLNFWPKANIKYINVFHFFKPFYESRSISIQLKFVFQMALVAKENIAAHNNTKENMQRHEVQQTYLFI